MPIYHRFDLILLVVLLILDKVIKYILSEAFIVLIFVWLGLFMNKILNLPE